MRFSITYFPVTVYNVADVDQVSTGKYSRAGNTLSATQNLYKHVQTPYVFSVLYPAHLECHPAFPRSSYKAEIREHKYNY